MTRPRLVPPVTTDGDSTAALRADVRAFLAEQLAAGTYTPRSTPGCPAGTRTSPRHSPGAAGWA